MSDLHDVAAVIVHYQNWPQVKSTIDDTLKAGVPARNIWVVDNSSDDLLASALPAVSPEVHLLNDQGNVGYAAGVNIGAAAAQTAGLAFLLVLTHEVRFSAATIGALRTHIEDLPPTTAVAPRIRSLHNPAVVWSEGGDLRRLRCLPVNRRAWRGSKADWVDGSVFMIPLSLFWSLDGMCEDYFLYMEEVDFFARLRDRGGEVHVLENGYALQAPGEMPFYLAVRNRIILARRVGSLPSFLFVVLECASRIAFAGIFQRRQIDKNALRRRALRDALSAAVDIKRSGPPQPAGTPL